MLAGGFFRLRQRHRGGDASAITAALNAEMTAQFRNAVPHAAQTDPNSCPGLVKAGKLFGGDTAAIVSYGYHRILIVRVQAYIHSIAARMPENVGQTLLQHPEEYKLGRLR